MIQAVRIVLSLSVGGSLLTGVIMLLRRVLGEKLSWQWKYYVWLLVLARLLVPAASTYGPAGALVSMLSGPPSGFVAESDAGVSQAEPDESFIGMNELDPGSSEAPGGREPQMLTAEQYAGLTWAGAACTLMCWHILSYRRIVRRVMRGARPASRAMAQWTADAAREMKIRRPVRLVMSEAVPSPLLFGTVRPVIVIPSELQDDAAFQCAVRHELVHCRRLDTAYKWLVQAAVCVHWFNPLVWWLQGRIARDCELSCDEAVVQSLDRNGRITYAELLVRTAAGSGRQSPDSAEFPALSSGGKVIRERVEAIMYTRTKSVVSAALCVVLTLALAAGAAASGGYAAEGASGQTRSSARGSVTQVSSRLSAQAEKYYEADRLPMFQFVVSKLSTADLQQWLTRTYNDRKVAFFSVVANALSYRAKLPESFARQAYEDQAVSYFSILADSMSDAQLETWLERALADGRISFCAMLYDKLDWKDELDQFQEELDRQLAAEYQKVGITLKGKSYYYKGQRVRTFLDIRANSAFYTLNTDPSGTVNVLVERSSNGSIHRVTCPTNAQIEQLLDA